MYPTLKGFKSLSNLMEVRSTLAAFDGTLREGLQVFAVEKILLRKIHSSKIKKKNLKEIKQSFFSTKRGR
jgi:prephenate dehydratase